MAAEIPIAALGVATLEQAWILRPAPGVPPAIVEPVTRSSDGELFCKVSKTLRWVSWWTVGATTSKRPMAGSHFTDVIHAAMARDILEAHRDAPDGIAQAPDAIADLGLDDDADSGDGAHDKILEVSSADSGAGPSAADAAGTGSRKDRKRKRQHRQQKEVLVLTVPRAKTGDGTMELRVLNKHMKEAVWIKLDSAHLEWLRHYVRSELVEGPTNVAKDAADPAQKAPFWCSAASCWRIKWRDAHGQFRTRNFYVARKPAETFAQRAADMRQQAVACLASE